MSVVPTVGAVVTWTRTFTEAEVRAFAELSGDKGAHHIETDERGRLMVHGLLTASLPTKLGGDMDYMAREMHFTFLKAVWTGDELSCEGRVDAVVAKPGRLKARMSFRIINQDGDAVLQGTTVGIVRR